MKKLFALLTSTALFVACGGADNNVQHDVAPQQKKGGSQTSTVGGQDTSDGTVKNACSYEFVNAYEKVRMQAYMMQNFATDSNWKELKSLCSQLFAKYGHVQCVAAMTVPGQLESTQETVSVHNLKPACDQAEKH